METILLEHISQKAESLRNKLIETRRDIYMYPELSDNEVRTSEIIVNKLKEIGLSVYTNIGGYGVIGLLEGKENEPVIAWRADMDAFAIQDTIDKPYKSRIQGVKHVCGHDANVTIALGIAEILASIRDNIHGTIKFIFQPNEEYIEGACAMIKNGALKNPKPQAIFGLHVSDFEVGKVKINSGMCLAGVDFFKITISPDCNICEIDYDNLQAECSKKLNGLSTYTGESTANKRKVENDKHVRLKVTDIKINNDKSELTICGQFFYSTYELGICTREHVKGIIDEIVRNRCISYSIEYIKSIPPVYNDKKMSEEANTIIKSLIGTNAYITEDDFFSFACDDFACFQKEVSGVFFFLGVANAQKGIKGTVHSTDFDIDEECLVIGTKVMSSFILGYLENQVNLLHK